jgi:hypothetical protein
MKAPTATKNWPRVQVAPTRQVDSRTLDNLQHAAYTLGMVVQMMNDGREPAEIRRVLTERGYK